MPTFFRIVAVLGVLLISENVFGFSSYHIGNSLTNDGLGGNTSNVTGLDRIADFYNKDMNVAYHLDSAQALHTIWNNPAGVGGLNGTKSPYEAFSNALPNYEWDSVLLEPYLTQGSTQGSDKQTISNFINLTHTNPANADTIFYVYQVWPSKQQYQADLGKLYSNYWKYPNPDNDATPTRARREYYQNIMKDLSDQYSGTGTVVRMIPTGEVFNRLSLMDLPGIDFTDFYRDDIHMAQDLGRYVAAATIYSTLLKKDVSNLIPPADYYDPAVLTTDLYTIINKVIWDVVSTENYTGIADFNNDGYVGSSDLTVWRNAFGINAAGDADGDGDTDGRDFLYWQRNFRGQPLGLIAAVPEPGSVVLLCGILGCCLSTRYSHR
jgi:hypothetical protein